MNSRVSRPDVSDVRLEMLNIHRIEADYRRIQSHITFRDMLAPIEWSLRVRQVLFNFVKRIEQWLDCLFIRLLSGGEAAFIDSVVYIVISPSIRFVDLLPEIFRV